MFSVVIPSYNHEEYLAEAVASAMTENLVTEILIADDGSSDRSVRLIEDLSESHPSKIRNLTQYPIRNIGAHARLNDLVSNAASKWIAVLNSDDKFAPGRFSAIRNRLRVEKFDFCFGNISIIDEESTVIGKKHAFLNPQYPFPAEEKNLGVASGELLKRLLSQNYIATTSNMVFTKDLWERVGGFRDYRYAHDWDFAIRSMMLGTAVYVPECLTLYRIHASNTIKEARTLQDEEVARIFAQISGEFEGFATGYQSLYLKSNEYLTNAK